MSDMTSNSSPSPITRLPQEIFSDIVTYLGLLGNFQEHNIESYDSHSDQDESENNDSEDSESGEESDADSDENFEEDPESGSDEGKSEDSDYEGISVDDGDEENASGSYALAPYACVSWQFLEAIERVTFRSLTIRSTDLSHFERLMHADSRRMHLKKLSIKIFLPDHPTPLPHRSLSTRSERDNWDNQQLSQTFRNILRILSEWSTDSKLELRILRITSRHFESTAGHYSAKEYLGRRPAPISFVGESLNREPSINFITSLEIISKYDRYRELEAGSAFRIAQHFPNLEKLYIEVPDRRYAENDLRLANRKKLAQEISRLSDTLTKLKKLLFSFKCADPMDHFFEPTSILDSSKIDPIGTVIRKLYNSSLTYIVLSGPLTLSADFFITNTNSSRNLFPNLVILDITFALVDANGDWLAETDDDPDLREGIFGSESFSDSEDEAIEHENQKKLGEYPYRRFRKFKLPVWEKWGFIMKSMAEMVRGMPSLKDFALECQNSNPDDISLTFNYLAPDTTSRGWRDPPEYLKKSRLYCGTNCQAIVERFQHEWKDIKGPETEGMVFKYWKFWES